MTSTNTDDPEATSPEQRPLAESIDRIIGWKMAGLSDRAIADQLGVANSSVSRFVKKPEVISAIDGAHKEMMRVAVRRSATAVGPALNIVLTALNPDTPDVPWMVRMKAADTIFRLVGAERMAEGMEGVGDALAGHVKDSLAAKIARMEGRVIDVEPVDEVGETGLALVL